MHVDNAFSIYDSALGGLNSGGNAPPPRIPSYLNLNSHIFPTFPGILGVGISEVEILRFLISGVGILGVVIQELVF